MPATTHHRSTDAAATESLPPLPHQAERLVALGVHTLAGIAADDLRGAAARLTDVAPPGALLVVRPDLAPPSALAPLLRRGERAGFVVEDMTDVDAFAPIAGTEPPGPRSGSGSTTDGTGADAALTYAVHGLDRGDAMAGWTPDHALPAITAAGRTPLTLVEGLHWVLQRPDVLERNHCFMTIGSRLRRLDGRLDARTPALWISNGTGRDGAARRDAPKVGWCWAGNHHAWLGFASAAGRTAGH